MRAFVAGLCLAALAFGASAARDPLAAQRWRSRILVVSAPSAEDAATPIVTSASVGRLTRNSSCSNSPGFAWISTTSYTSAAAEAITRYPITTGGVMR